MLLGSRLRRASRPAAVAFASAAIILLTACSGDAAITPLPSGAALPTDCAAADADNVITLSARNLEFSAPCLIAPADTAFTIHFTNEESIPHDVALYADSSKETEYFRGEVITGPGASIDYRVDPVSAGDHFFDCIVHPSMKGTLYVR